MQEIPPHSRSVPFTFVQLRVGRFGVRNSKFEFDCGQRVRVRVRVRAGLSLFFKGRFANATSNTNFAFAALWWED